MTTLDARSNKIIGVAAPTAQSTDAANAAYVDAAGVTKTGHIQTVNTAAAQTISGVTYTPAPEEVTQIVVVVLAKKTSDQTSGILRKRASFTTHTGTITPIGTTADVGSDLQAGAAAWAATITVSAGTIIVQVQDPGGGASTIDWTAIVVATAYGI